MMEKRIPVFPSHGFEELSFEESEKVAAQLGLGKINSYVEKEATPDTMGMVRVVEHLVKVEEI